MELASVPKDGRKTSPLDTMGLCLLSLDGGGVRGLSTLYILRGIMRRLNHERQSRGLTAVKPCEVFDLIGGTSTGGLIAIMLGRLGMDVDECIDAYSMLAESVFRKPSTSASLGRRGQTQVRFDSGHLERAVQTVAASMGSHGRDKLCDGVDRGCRVFVCTADVVTQEIVRLRSYILPKVTNVPATICEAALATSAATTFFEPVRIGDYTFADGRLVANNPIDEVEGEAVNIWGSQTEDLEPLIKCFISIGTGNPDKKAFEDILFKSLGQTVVDVATATENTERMFIARHKKQFRQDHYFRFNVDQGLQDIGLQEYREQRAIEVATEIYLTYPERKVRVEECIRELTQKENRTPTPFDPSLYKRLKESHRQRRISPRVSVPYVTVSTYTEREKLSQQLAQSLKMPNRDPSLARTIAVTGLGGTGKTQLVLRYIQTHGHAYDTIFWVDGRNEQTVRSSFERCCHALGLVTGPTSGQRELQAAPDVRAVLQWLLGRQLKERWLVVIENLDDYLCNISNIVPSGPAGSVIVTSPSERVPRILGLKRRMILVDVMEKDEAVSLLLNTIDRNTEIDRIELDDLPYQIVFSLDMHPLAIKLAGGQIQAQMRYGKDAAAALRQYQREFERQQDRLSKRKDFAQSNSYHKTVWTVWETTRASIEKSDEERGLRCLRLLTFLTLLDTANVPDELFRLASVGLQTTCKMLDTRVATWLEDLISIKADGEWDNFEYRACIEQLRQYGLVRSVVSPWSGWTMHGLVRLRTRYESDLTEYWQWYAVFIAAACNRMLYEDGQAQFRRQMTAHLPRSPQPARYVSGWGEKLPVIWTAIGRIWELESRWEEAESFFYECLAIRKTVLGAEHPDTLTSMNHLVSTYRNQERWKEAEELQVAVMKTQKRVLGAEYPDTLRSMENLASTYYHQGRLDEAEQLQAVTIDTRKRVLGAEHPDTLRNMESLASTYYHQGRLDEAEQLQAVTTETRKRVLGAKHPDTLKSMESLASTYYHQGRLDEAEELRAVTTETRKRVLGAEHPDTLRSMENLASTYCHQGRLNEAEELQEVTIKTRKRVLGAEHPDTLRSMENLALTHYYQGRLINAEELQAVITKTRKRVLGVEHPDTLRSMENLVLTYRDQGRQKEAEELRAIITETRKKVPGAEHLDTLRSMKNLTLTYRDQGRQKETEELQDTVMDSGTRVLGAAHLSQGSGLMLPNSSNLPQVVLWEDWEPLVRKSYVLKETFTFTILWKLRECLQDDLDSLSDLGSTLTLTGDSVRAYTTTCQQYVREQWQDTGSFVLNAVCVALKDGNFMSEVLAINLEDIDGDALVERARVQAIDLSFEEVVSVVQTLAWLAVSFRPSIAGQLLCSSALARHSPNLEISLGDLGEVRSTDQESCWQSLFRGSVIAQQFPVRTGERGLELPFPVMLDITGVLYCTDLAKYYEEQKGKYGIFYTGVHSILYPVDRGERGHVIRWHYATSDEVMIPPGNDRWLQIRQIDELENATTILGYTPMARVHLGTSDRLDQYEQMQNSSADREKDGATFTWDGITLQAGYSGSGIAFPFKYKKRNGRRATTDAKDQQYDEIVNKTAKKPVILFDTSPEYEVGWLVPQLSVILDLVHCKVRKEGFWDTAEHNALYASLQSDGGVAATTVLNDYNNANKMLYSSAANGKPFTVQDLVTQIFVAMSVRAQQDLQERLLVRNSTPLVGWDLIELLSPPDTSYRLEKKIYKTSTSLKNIQPSWFPLVQEVPVYFCDNLGNIISSKVPLCYNFQRGLKHLIASVHALRLKLKNRPGCSDYHLDIHQPLIWELPRKRGFTPYNHFEHHSHSAEGRFLDEIQLFISPKSHNCRITNGRCSLEPDGAVIFGAGSSILESLSDFVEDFEHSLGIGPSSRRSDQ